MNEHTAEKDAPESWWRVTITHGALTKVSTARRRFRCEGHIAPVRHYIEPGQRYVRTSLPPDHPEINNDSWWHMRLCMACCPVEFTRVDCGSTAADWCLAENGVECARHDENGDRRARA